MTDANITSRSGGDGRLQAHTVEALLEAAQGMAHVAPFVLVVEDLHWASPSTRDIVLALVRTGRAPLLTVLTFRSDDVTSGHPLQPALVELTRSPGVVRIDVEGLTAPDVLQLVSRRCGRAAGPDELASLMTRSGRGPTAHRGARGRRRAGGASPPARPVAPPRREAVGPRDAASTPGRCVRQPHRPRGPSASVRARAGAVRGGGARDAREPRRRPPWAALHLPARTTSRGHSRRPAAGRTRRDARHLRAGPAR